jgi:hypothetical protein
MSKIIPVGSRVLVSPKEDNPPNEFMGVVLSFNTANGERYYVVRDQEDDCFCVDPDQVNYVK